MKCPNCGRPLDEAPDQYDREVQKCPDLDLPHCGSCCPWKTASPGAVLICASVGPIRVTANGGNGGGSHVEV
jgi:hypothetical protein